MAFMESKKEKVVFVLGATGTGKSKLSIGLATHFGGEIVNSDKMQVHEGLAILTNKVPQDEQCGIPHHLLGVLDAKADFTTSDFCIMACRAIELILEQKHLPIIAGGSNTYIKALVESEGFRSKYECLFIWLDVLPNALYPYLSKRVDEMMDAGMEAEVRDFISRHPNDYDRGILRSIGVQELDKYFQQEPYLDKERRPVLLKQAIDDIKKNTFDLASRQLQKIQHFSETPGRNVYRIDATKIFLKKSLGEDTSSLWKDLVFDPSVQLVQKFLHGAENSVTKQINIYLIFLVIAVLAKLVVDVMVK